MIFKNINPSLLGHALGIFTIIVWGATFSSTKSLLQDFNPIEILFLRFLFAYILLVIFHPKPLKFKSFKVELLLMFAGFFGICLYYLLENIALKFTEASNVSVLVSISPIFTAILSVLFFKKYLSLSFFIGFLFSFIGIILVVFNGNFGFNFSPLGDILCILAGLAWSFYTIFLDKLLKIYKNSNPLVLTRRIFFYGLLLILPILYFYGFNLNLSRFYNPLNLFNFIFLGVFASALCYISWSGCMKYLGSIKASSYIYSIPFIGVIIASVFLGEKITIWIVLGGVLTILGLFLSQKDFR